MATGKDVERFAQKIGGGPLGLIFHRPESDARPTECFTNVTRKVARDGGCVVFGWMFHVRLVEALEKEYLVAVHHAVWNLPDGCAVDVTPFHEDPKHHPLASNGDVLFLVDVAAKPRVVQGAPASLPTRYFAVGDDANLAEHIRRLEAEEAQTCERIYAAAEAAPSGATIDTSGIIIV